MAARKDYGNESISSLKGADRVRKRPAFLRSEEGLHASIFLAGSPSGIRPLLGMAIFPTNLQDICGGIVNHG